LVKPSLVAGPDREACLKIEKGILMADASAYADNIKKYSNGYNQAAAERIVGHLGIALRNRDSSLVACSDNGELDRVREKWCRGKLGVAHKQAELDAAIQAICARMKDEGGQKSRVTFYYLLAEHFGKLDALAR
jgi:hypothetical protein